jgi:hypothetical protein
MACFLLGASELKADTVVFAHTVSHHVNQSANFNESNYGLGMRHYTTKDRYITAGTYINSEYNRSNYAGFGWETKGNLKLGLSVGLITGYSLLSVSPYIVPSIRHEGVSLIFLVYPEAVTHLTVDLIKF